MKFKFDAVTFNVTESKPTLETVIENGGIWSTESEKLPSKSATVPVVLPATTLAPGIGLLFSSLTEPVTVVWAKIIVLKSTANIDKILFIIKFVLIFFGCFVFI